MALRGHFCQVYNCRCGLFYVAMAEMGARKSRECYVYRLFDRLETVYVGKGSGRRLAQQKKRFACDGEVIVSGLTDDEAFLHERRLIAELRPTANILPGGNGGRHRPKPLTKGERDFRKFERELWEVGSRRYVARFLMTRLNASNIGRFSISPERLATVQAVANGPAL